MPESASPTPLDELDRLLIRELSHDGRASFSELSRRVGVAESTCRTRVRHLVERGVITGFRAEVDPAALGRGLEALVEIRVHGQARSALRAFQDFLEKLPVTRSVYFVSGEHDFLMHVAVKDTSELRALISDHISRRKEVAATNTSLIFSYTSAR